jgi:DNA-binding MarR family transcriptional regulator
VHQTSVTNAVDRLESAHLVRRLPHPSDRRTTLIEITDEGRAVAATATQRLNETVFADPGITAEDTTSLVAILARLRREAGDFG